MGSGVVIDPSGILVTNKHVIQDAAIIRVTFNDRSRVSGQLIAAATYTDNAVLEVNVPNALPTLSFADSDAAKIGQPVVAIGNPLGIGTSVSTGVISGLNRDLTLSIRRLHPDRRRDQPGQFRWSLARLLRQDHRH